MLVYTPYRHETQPFLSRMCRSVMHMEYLLHQSQKSGGIGSCFLSSSGGTPQPAETSFRCRLRLIAFKIPYSTEVCDNILWYTAFQAAIGAVARLCCALRRCMSSSFRLVRSIRAIARIELLPLYRSRPRHYRSARISVLVPFLRAQGA